MLPRIYAPQRSICGSDDAAVVHRSKDPARVATKEARCRAFDVGSSKYAPSVSGRLACLSLSADISDYGSRVASAENAGLSLSVARRATATLSASGFQGNVGGGVLTKLSPRVNRDLGLAIGLGGTKAAAPAAATKPPARRRGTAVPEPATVDRRPTVGGPRSPDAPTGAIARAQPRCGSNWPHRGQEGW